MVTPKGETWKYEYDAFGRRVRKIGPQETITYLWDGGVVAEEIRETRNSSTTASWFFEPGTFHPVAKVENGKSYACVTDQIGTPRELVSANGELAWSAQFTTWGEIDELKADKVDCPIRFQGQWYDEESGLHYNWNRYYEADTRRYLSPEPVGLNGGTRTFGYVHNPVSWVDPLGLAGCDQSKIWQDSAGRWRDPQGRFAKNPGWPDNYGFQKGADHVGTLDVGTKIDRFGGPGGDFMADEGTPFGQRSLPSSSFNKDYHLYEVAKPIPDVRTGPAEPWFGQPGGGIQHQLPQSVQDLINSGHLVELPTPPKPT